MKKFYRYKFWFILVRGKCRRDFAKNLIKLGRVVTVWVKFEGKIEEVDRKLSKRKIKFQENFEKIKMKCSERLEKKMVNFAQY